MKQIIVSFLCALAVLTADAQFLFRISGGGLEKPSYILGTIHTLSGAVLDSIPEYLEIEAQCQQLYAELEFTKEKALINSNNQVYAVIEIVVKHPLEEATSSFYMRNNIIVFQYNINGEDLVNIEKRLHCPDLISNVHCPACIARERAYVPLIRTRTYSRKVFEKGRWRKRYPRL